MTTTKNLKGLSVPVLDHDKMMLERFGERYTLSSNGKRERRIVWAMYAHLKAAGFLPTTVFDGEDNTKVADAKAAMELIFNLDEASARFAKCTVKHRATCGTISKTCRCDEIIKGKVHGVLLVLGNGEDIVSDWNYTEGDADGFNAVMDAFRGDEVA